jgi:hypothetical protein
MREVYRTFNLNASENPILKSIFLDKSFGGW